MERVICYGAGGEFKRCIGEIKEQYEVIAVTAQDNPRLSDYTYIEPVRLKDVEYDKIIITSEDYVLEIYKYLSGDLQIESDKILFYSNVCKEKRKKYYGQQKEDQIAELLLKIVDIDISQIHYVEFGICHPIRISNTYYFYQQGASGVLVEPNRHLKPLIEMVRPRDTLLNVAIGGEKGQIHFYECQGIGLSTCKKPDEEFHENYKVTDEYDVEMITLNDVMEHLGTSCEILSVDTEGMEYEVLSAFDFDKYKPLIIIVEVAGFLEKYEKWIENANAIDKLLTENQYKQIFDNGTNYIFIRKEAVQFK